MNDYSGEVPEPTIAAFSRELTGMRHGTVALVFHVRDGRLARYEIDQKQSYLLEYRT
jgi:hypothetical protein